MLVVKGEKMDETKEARWEPQQQGDDIHGGVGETVTNPIAATVGSALGVVETSAGVAGSHSTRHRATNVKSKLNRQASTGSSELSVDRRLQDRIVNKRRKKAAHRRKLKRSHAKG